MNLLKYAFVLLVFAGVGMGNTIYIPSQPVDMLDGTFTRTAIAYNVAAIKYHKDFASINQF